MALTIDDSEKQPDKTGQGPQMGNQPPVGQQQKPQGSGFTNLNRVIGANQNNRLGSTIGANIQGQANQAKQGINQASQNFQQQAQANQIGGEQDVQKLNTTLQNPVGANEQDVKDFSRFRSGQYQGPRDIENKQQVYGNAQQAEAMGQATGSQLGRQGLLQRYVGNNQYNQGKQNLDSLLLGRTGGNDLRAARQASQGLAGQAQTQSATAQGIAAQNQQMAQNFANQTNQAIAGKTNPVLDELTKRMATAEQEKATKLQGLRKDLYGGEISAEDAASLGLNEGQELYGADLSKALNPAAIQANQQNVANSQEAANLNALNKLAGKDQFGDESQAGSFYKNQFGVDKDAVNKLVQQQKTAYEQETNPLKGFAGINESAGKMQDYYKQLNEQSGAVGRAGNDIRDFEVAHGGRDPEGNNIFNADNLSAEDKAQYNKLQQGAQSSQDSLNSLYHSPTAGGRDNIFGLVNQMGLDSDTRGQIAKMIDNRDYGTALNAIRAGTQGQADQLAQVNQKYQPGKKLQFKKINSAVNPSAT
jgi:hypothetical protein